MKEQIQQFETLYTAYVDRFGVEPEWNLAPVEKQISDMEDALRLGRPIPEDPVQPDILI